MTDIEASGYATLPEIASRLDPDGAEAQIINIAANKKPFLRDMLWAEGNLPTGHQITQTSSTLPSGTWRMANTGVEPTKAETVQYVETCGRLETEIVIDEALLELNGGMTWRKSEEQLQTEGLAQQLSTAIFYESVSTNPERIHGLAPRYFSATDGIASSYVLIGTNAGSNARSVWIVSPGPRKLYGIYPKGTRAGLQVVDNGRQRVLDSSSNAFYAYSTSLIWRCGVVVEDYRHAVRVQYDPDDAEMANTEKGLYQLVMDGLQTIYDADNARIVMDRTTAKLFNRQLMNAENRPMEYVAMGGKMLGDSASQGGPKMPHFMGHPVYVDDSLVAETAITS